MLFKKACPFCLAFYCAFLKQDITVKKISNIFCFCGECGMITQMTVETGDDVMREYAVAATEIQETMDFDVVVFGAGAAGLYTALNLDRRLSVAVLNKRGLEESNSMYAQGGIAAVVLKEDTYEHHVEDTLIAGAGLCDEDAVRVLVHEGPAEIKKLIDMGVPFDRDACGDIVVSREGAHRVNRIVHCGGDATGLHLTTTLAQEVCRRENITVLNGMTVFDILTDKNGAVSGVLGQDDCGNNVLIHTSYCVTATGGIGRVFRSSTNSNCATGDGIACALRAGAELKNMEFVQFHPTALIHPDANMRYFLISEALRGEGAVLRNRKWEAFMKDVHPMADLAPRDIVTRAISEQMHRYDLPNVYLDITSRSREFLSKRFPVIYEECMKRGIDIAVNWIPVIPVQHYFMGGIKTDLWGRSTVEGLYACGESSCSGVHGANRLASNSLLECLVFGNRCAQDINNHAVTERKNPEMPAGCKEEKEFDFDASRTHIRRNMTKKGGIIRNREKMEEAIELIGGYYDQLKQMNLKKRIQVETLNMATVGLQILNAAMARKKSVGAHFRSDEEK
jgi:L-aspartate oxidase